MHPKFKISVIPLSSIQVSRSQSRCKDIAAKRNAMRVIRRVGQQAPLVIDADNRLIADTTLYLALKALDYDLVKVVTLENPSPAAVRLIRSLLDHCKAIVREAAAFNAVLASVDEILGMGSAKVVLDLLPVVITDTDMQSYRLFPAFVPHKGRRTPSDI